MPAPSPLKLLFLCGSSGSGFGGAEMNFLRTCRAFSRLGAGRTTVLPVVRRGTWLDQRLSEEKIPHETCRFGGLLDFFTKPKLKKIIAREQPSLVQTWMNRATSMTPKVKGIPFIGRLGGYYDLKYYQNTDYLIANTQGIVRYILDHGWPETKVSMVQNFASLPAESFAESRHEVRKHYNLPEGAVVLVSSSRLHPHKGQDTILRALAQLPEQVHYLVIGNGPDEAMLKDLAEKLGVASRVRFVGWVNNISPLCAAADIFVVASRVEPFGNVILDAWAHGLPLVTSNAAGPAEIVDNGTNGLIYPIDDADALAAKIKLLLAEPVLAQGLAAAGYQHVRTHYTEDAIINQYLTLYNRLLTEQGNTK